MDKIHDIKKLISPKNYYSYELVGYLSNKTGNGWYLWKGLCPFHNDKKSGSFFINIETGAFKCFSCGVSGGDIIDFQKQKYSQTFSEAISSLKERF